MQLVQADDIQYDTKLVKNILIHVSQFHQIHIYVSDDKLQSFQSLLNGQNQLEYQKWPFTDTTTGKLYHRFIIKTLTNQKHKQINQSNIQSYFSTPSRNEPSVDSLLGKICDCNVKTLLQPLNVNNNHWILLKIDLTTCVITIYDSMNTIQNLDNLPAWFQGLANKLTDYYNKLRTQVNITTGPTTWSWKAQTVSPKQKDAYNCGIYVCKIAEALMRGVDIDVENIDKLRSDVHTTLQTIQNDHMAPLHSIKKQEWLSADHISEFMKQLNNQSDRKVIALTSGSLVNKAPGGGSPGVNIQWTLKKITYDILRGCGIHVPKLKRSLRNANH